MRVRPGAPKTRKVGSLPLTFMRAGTAENNSSAVRSQRGLRGSSNSTPSLRDDDMETQRGHMIAQGRSQNWKQAFCSQVHCTHHRAEESQVAVCKRKGNRNKTAGTGGYSTADSGVSQKCRGADPFCSPFQVCSLTPSKLIQRSTDPLWLLSKNVLSF